MKFKPPLGVGYIYMSRVKGLLGISQWGHGHPMEFVYVAVDMYVEPLIDRLTTAHSPTNNKNLELSFLRTRTQMMQRGL